MDSLLLHCWNTNQLVTKAVVCIVEVWGRCAMSWIHIAVDTVVCTINGSHLVIGSVEKIAGYIHWSAVNRVRVGFSTFPDLWPKANGKLSFPLLLPKPKEYPSWETIMSNSQGKNEFRMPNAWMEHTTFLTELNACCCSSAQSLLDPFYLTLYRCHAIHTRYGINVLQHSNTQTLL